MSLLSFLRRRGSAPVAHQRLQILLAHERAVIGQSDLITVLREEILAAIAKHVRMDPDKVQVKMERGDAVSTLEVDVEIPLNTHLAAAIGRA
jgi:cell division topological specificity factor